MAEQEGQQGGLVPLLVAVALLALIGSMVYTAFDFPEQARRIPLVIGGPVVVFLVVQVMREIFALRGSRSRTGTTNNSIVRTPVHHDHVEEEDSLGANEAMPGRSLDEPGEIAEPAVSIPAMYGWIVVLALSFWSLGMVLGIPVFIAVFARIYGGESWRSIVLMAVGTLLVVQGFFVQILGIQMHRGVLLTWLGL